MPAPGKRPSNALRWLVGVGISILFVGVVIYRGLHPGVRCEVCIEFRGNQACRTVDGSEEREVRTSAINNTCAQLASGVTDSMACERTAPFKESCNPL